jgi:hypothetical protein
VSIDDPMIQARKKKNTAVFNNKGAQGVTFRKKTFFLGKGYCLFYDLKIHVV